MTAAIETGATAQAPGVAGMAGKANETCTGQGGQRQEKSNLRVSDSVASPCCRALISLNLARAWELVPIPQSCLAHVSSNPTRRDLSLPTLFNNERYPAPNNSLTTEYWSVLLPGGLGSHQRRGVSDS